MVRRRVLLAAAAVAGATAVVAVLLATGMSSGKAQPVLPPLPRGVLSPINQFTPAVGRSRPKGYVMLVHGGAWILVGHLATEPQEAAWFNSQGWAAYDIDYRPGILSVADVITAYDHLRAQVGPDAAICVDGSSVGGQLVMLLAAVRPSVDCVISEAGIVNLPAMANQTAYGGIRGCITPGAQFLFGKIKDGLWRLSPQRVAGLIKQPVLMAGSSYDACIDEPAQMAEMKSVRPQTKVMLLQGAATPPGQRPNFPHASVTPQALARFHDAVLKLLASVTHLP